MADVKKEEKKPDLLMEVVGLLVAMLFLGLIIQRIEQYIAYTAYGSYASFKEHFTLWFLTYFWPVVKALAFIITAFFTFAIVHALRGLNAIRKEENEFYGLKDVVIEDEGNVVENKNEKWEKIVEHINSPNESDWRLAIIEADIMLEDLMRAAGYHGDNLGDMLKSVEKSDFTSIESAWEAHKVRNKIAHSGSEFPLNEREAKMTIAQFEAVFKEFKII